MKPRIFLSPPHMGGLEQQFIRQVFESNYIAPAGPEIEAFEQAFCEYTGISHCVALSSGTAAMHLALKELGVEPGDEVIGSTLTFVGSISPVIFQCHSKLFTEQN
ncbi:MAG: DegT/DnrJ/EryC1/StrS family aminotransferase [Thermodesulfobacteriota bacterium]|nr:DegT/DnrJ/EryC1/StrS family aminotransferase [Thermodesulfobacteriota bacterium]